MKENKLTVEIKNLETGKITKPYLVPTKHIDGIYHAGYNALGSVYAGWSHVYGVKKG